MKAALFIGFIWVLLITASFYIESTICNPKGSLAAQINWAGNPECNER